MSHRRIEGLLWARESPITPHSATRARGAKLAGLRYERALARALPLAEHGRWFEFADGNGHGFCQPDLILTGSLLSRTGFSGRYLLVLEAKYTWVEEGHRQLEELYVPVLRPVYPGYWLRWAVVSKRLRPGMDGIRIVQTVPEVLEARESRVCLHWMGLGPLFPTPMAGRPSPVAPQSPEALGL